MLKMKFKSRIKNGIFVVMCIITALFIVMPLFLKFPVVRKSVAWVLSGLKYQEYKSAYLGLTGGLIGSWFAITGAIYTQRKFDRENEQRKIMEEKKTKEINRERIKVICKEILWNEMRQNDYALRGDGGEFIKAIMKESDNHFYNRNSYRITINNWNFIRDKVISMDIDLAIRLMHLYKYYEFMIDFEGSAKDAFRKSQLDFGKYEECYKAVVKYLEYPWIFRSGSEDK